MIEKKTEKKFHSTLKFLIISSLCLSVLSLIIGIPFVLLNLDLPPVGAIEHDTREFFEFNIRYLIRFLGIIFTIFGLAGLLGSVMMSDWIDGIYSSTRKRIGWLLLVGVYFVGLVGCLYIVYRVIMMVLNSTINPIILVSAISSPLIFIIIWGIFGLVTLLRKQTIVYYF